MAQLLNLRTRATRFLPSLSYRSCLVINFLVIRSAHCTAAAIIELVCADKSSVKLKRNHLHFLICLQAWTSS